MGNKIVVEIAEQSLIDHVRRFCKANTRKPCKIYPKRLFREGCEEK